MRTGGVAPPLARARNSRFLSLAEPKEISRGVLTGLSLRTIAQQLHRCPSIHICESMVAFTYEGIDTSLLVSDLIVSRVELEELCTLWDETRHWESIVPLA